MAQTENVPMFATLAIAFTLTLQPAPRESRVPLTIEAVQDVVAKVPGPRGDERLPRGVLSLYGLSTINGESEVFTVKKGERFAMIEILNEGECRIRLRGRELNVSSCYWLEGFTDHQSDFFKVVPRR